MKNKVLLPILVLVVTLATIAFNSLANILPLNGLNTGEISDRFDVYFVPAGYVFSIWGLIYIALTAYSIYQLLPGQQNDARLRSIAPLYILASVANMGWLALWHFEQIPLSLGVMLVLLGTLITIYLRLDIGRRRVSTAQALLVHLPFSLYLGWVSVATIANVTSVLDFVEWTGWGVAEVTWAVVMLAVAGVLAIIVQLARRDLVYNLVFIWALTGIAVKHSDTQAVALTAYVVSAVILAAVVANFLRTRFFSSPSGGQPTGG